MTTGNESKELLGNRMVAAGLLTAVQRDALIEMQKNLQMLGKWKRFGELAVEQGFCTQEQIEEVILAAEERQKNQSW